MDDRPRADDPPAAEDRPKTRSPGAETALVHLYRGELGRMTSYRRRLDTTTNWAISFAGAVASLSLGTETIPHTVILLGMLLMLFFLVLEGRRFRSYEVSRARVEMLERGYFPDVLKGDTAWPWVDPLLEQLRNPRPPLDTRAAIGWRLRRNYLWIYLVVLVAWLFKLQWTGGPSGDLGVLIARAGAGPLPGWIVLAGVVAFYAVLVALTLTAMRRYPHGEDW